MHLAIGQRRPHNEPEKSHQLKSGISFRFDKIILIIFNVKIKKKMKKGSKEFKKKPIDKHSNYSTALATCFDIPAI